MVRNKPREQIGCFQTIMTFWTITVSSGDALHRWQRSPIHRAMCRPMDQNLFASTMISQQRRRRLSGFRAFPMSDSSWAWCLRHHRAYFASSLPKASEGDLLAFQPVDVFAKALYQIEQSIDGGFTQDRAMPAYRRVAFQLLVGSV